MTCQTSARCCSGLLPIREEVSGPTHPDTLTARADLAEFTGEAGDPAAARDQFTELLYIQEKVLGPRHPDTLTTRENLAHWRALASRSESMGGSISNWLAAWSRIGPAACRRRRR